MRCVGEVVLSPLLLSARAGRERLTGGRSGSEPVVKSNEEPHKTGAPAQ